MAQVSEIKASARAGAGQGAARAVRRESRVPAVLYGGGEQPQNLSVDAKDITITVGKGKFLSTVFALDIDGTKVQAIPREVQVDPVKDRIIHIDFQRVGKGSKIRVSVPVRFVNEAASPGLKRGGVLNIVRHTVEVMAPADAIPEVFEFSLEGLEIGRSIHISATKMPEGVRPTITNRDFTIATIAGQTRQEEETPTAGAAAAAAPADGAAAAPAAAGDAKAAAAKAPAGKDAAKPAAAKPAAKK
jgi:large subunit ribosomal protein L25